MSESIKVSKSNILLLMNQGLKAKEIAEKMGISTLSLAKGCKLFGIELRKKPRLNIEFIDDSIIETNTEEPSNQTNLFTEEVITHDTKEINDLVFNTNDNM